VAFARRRLSRMDHTDATIRGRNAVPRGAKIKNLEELLVMGLV
jgi:hypothetical protein